MLNLKLPTDPRWVNIVESNIEEVLTDHAYCEQKAASNAISIIVKHPEHTELVQELLIIAQEELDHFKQVHDKIIARGWTLGPERKDKYVNHLYAFMEKGGSKTQRLVERLLFAALIEARSCERFKVLSENINDTELKEFYKELMISEAGHYTIFLNFAKKLGEGIDVDKRWKEFLEFEGELIQKFGNKETIHG